MSKDDIKDEYLDVSENIRHWENMRFAQLTVFIAVMAGLISVIFQMGSSLSDIAQIFIKIAGILMVIIFWVMDERGSAILKELPTTCHYTRKGIKLPAAFTLSIETSYHIWKRDPAIFFSTSYFLDSNSSSIFSVLKASNPIQAHPSLIY